MMSTDLLEAEVVDAPRQDHGDGQIPPEEPGDDDGGGDGPDGPWVTIATFDNPVYANLARLKLESEGIDCFLADEMIVATDWLVSNAVGGIKLQVQEAVAERARELLAKPTATPTLDYAEPEPMTCPRCGATDVQPLWKTPGILLTSLFFLGLPMLLARGKMRCERCLHPFIPRRGFPLDRPEGIDE